MVEKKQKNLSRILLVVAVIVLIFAIFFFGGFNKITGNYLYGGNYSDIGYAPPYNVFENNTQIITVSPEYSVMGVDEDNLEILVNVSVPGGMVYKVGYYYDAFRGENVPFEFSQETVGDSDWISSSASINLTFAKNQLRSNLANFIYVYPCKKYNDEWKCGCINTSDSGCGFWSLQMFKVNVTDDGATRIITTCQELQNMKNDLGAKYQLGEDLDCESTMLLNNGKGFEPVGKEGYDEVCLKDYEVETKEIVCNSIPEDYFYDENCNQNCASYGLEWNEENSTCYSSYVGVSEEGYSACLNVFTGEFDGNGFDIVGLNINRPEESNVGLFGVVQNVKVLNLNLKNVNINGKNKVGSVVGYGSGEISNVMVGGNVSATGGNLGGLVGSGNFLISDSGMTGNVLAPKTTTCYSSNPKECNVGTYVGGILGSASSALIEHSFFEGTLDNWGTVSGGLVGSGAVNILDSYVNANITGYGAMGGLVGSGSGVQINNSYSSGIMAQRFISDHYTYPVMGGIIGYAYSSAIINSFSTSDLHASQNTRVNWIVGDNNGLTKIINCSFGGIVSGNYYVVSHSIPRNNAGVINFLDKSGNLDYFKTQSNEPMRYWDFANVWQTNTNGYPTLK